MSLLEIFLDLSFFWHICCGIVIRLVLIIYAGLHDMYYTVPYTDVDYKVFTDAARHILDGVSPYRRHTYRYSPIIAYLMIPNVVISKDFGKILFSLFDVLVTLAIKTLVRHQMRNQTKCQHLISKVSKCCALIWLYNPLSIAISTRGNADSVPCFLIIMSIFFLQTTAVKSVAKYALAGIFLGVAIHLRLYPLIFSYPMYLSLNNVNVTADTTLGEYIRMILPNRKQIILALSCIFSLAFLTCVMYRTYGYEFLFETYLYHLFRHDSRHNFSVLFYYNYLAVNQNVNVLKELCVTFHFVIQFVLSLTFGCDSHLPLALFTQAVVMVAFNSVVTSQYFIWYLSLLPLVAHNFCLKPSKALVLVLSWCLSQTAWLFIAYLLEFKGRDTFIYIWIMGLVFFGTNIYILCTLVRSYKPGHAFGFAPLNDFKTK